MRRGVDEEIAEALKGGSAERNGNWVGLEGRGLCAAC